MKLGDFRSRTKDLPDTADIGYHSYDNGCGLSAYDEDMFWIFGADTPDPFIVINPDEDYDDRRPPITEVKT